MFKYVALLTVIAVAADNGLHVPIYLIPLLCLAVLTSFIVAVMVVTVERLNKKEEK